MYQGMSLANHYVSGVALHLIWSTILFCYEFVLSIIFNDFGFLKFQHHCWNDIQLNLN